MRILIDLQAAQNGSRLRGIGRYSIALAEAMIKAGSQHEFSLLLNGMLDASIPGIRERFEALVPRERILVWHAVGPVDWLSDDNAARRVAAELVREAFIAFVAPDVVHVTAPSDGFGDATTFTIGAFGPRPATAITFYDVIPLVQREVYLTPYPTFEAMYHRRLEDMTRADAFLAISEHSRSEAIAYLGVPQSSVHNISADADAVFRRVEVRPWARKALASKFGLAGRFILYSGATDERKNHLRLIAAYSMLAPPLRRQFQLVFVGLTPTGHREKFRHYAAARGLSEKDFVIVGGVSDEELLLFYNLCSLFVMPSWHEGFGLPALEAMRCGAPVIGAASASLPELIDDPQALFDPFSASSIAAKMTELLSSPTALQRLATRGTQRAATFSWQRSARTAIDALELLPRHEMRVDASGIVDQLIDKLGHALPATSDDAFLRDLAKGIDTTFVASRERHLLVDISEMIRVDAKTGIQRVVKNILNALLTHPPENYRVIPVYTVRESGWYQYARRYAREVLRQSQGPFQGEDDPIDVRAGDIFLGLDLHHRTPPREVDICERMRAVGGYAYFVVYDLLPVLMPQHFTSGPPPRHLEWLLGVARSDGAVCISRSVADEFIAWLPSAGLSRPLRVGFFHLGSDIADDDSRVDEPEHDSLLEAMRARTSFLMVGTLEPRKGHLDTLIAFDALWDSGHDINLVIVGKHGWNVDLQVELIRTHPERGKRLFWLPAVSDRVLTSIYRQADCLIAASEGEGFGLPLVEAATRGVGVIARDIPVFREVADRFATFFAGDDAASLAAAVRQWLGRGRAERTSAPPEQPITWLQSKDQLLDCIVGGRWYWRGEPAALVRLTGSDCRLVSAVGRRTGTSLRSTFQAGFLAYGHYMRCGPGKHFVTLQLSFFAKGWFSIDVTTGRGTDVISSMDRLSPPRGDAAINLNFTLTDAATDIEVRLKVDADIGLVLHSLSIAPMPERAAYDEIIEVDPYEVAGPSAILTTDATPERSHSNHHQDQA